MSVTAESPQFDLRDLLRVLLRRKWLFAVPWAVATGLGICGAFLLPPIYFSNVIMRIERPQQLKNLGDMVGSNFGDQQADIMREQVQSQVFLRGVIQATALKNDPRSRAWAIKQRAHYPGLTDDELVEAALMDYLRDNVAIAKGKGNIVQLSVGDAYPERARKLADAVSNGFVASSKTAQLEAVRAAQEFTSDQLLVYKHRLDEAEERLESFRRTQLASSVVSGKVNAGNASSARELVDAADLELDDLHTRAQSLRTQLGSAVSDADIERATSADVRNLTAQMIALERQLAASLLTDPGQGGSGLRYQLSRRYSECEAAVLGAAGTNLPSLGADARQILVRLRMAQIETQTVSARRSAITAQIADYEHQVVATPDREAQEQRLRSDVEANRALYNTFLQQMAAAQIAEAFQNAKVGGRFMIINPATMPTSPGKPNRPALILLSFVVGGVVGIGTVFLAEHHDFSLKTAEDVEQLLGLPVLGAIPRSPELERTKRNRQNPNAPRLEGGLINLLKVESPLGLEFRRIYLKLARSNTRPLPHTLLITSGSRAEGKTTVSGCLALTLARESGKPVLAVDFDLRSPSLHRALGLPSSSRGLAQMLDTRSFEERLVRTTAAPHLVFLPAGKSDKPASALINDESVEWFMREAKSRYPIIVVDCAPNLAVPDAFVLGRTCDAVVFVVKAGATVRKAAEHGVRQQREARDNVLGVLMNDASELLPYYYGYRYNYYGYATSEAAAGES